MRRLVVEKYGAIEGGGQTLARLAEYVAREDSVAERELAITRVFDTPARLLFEAYSRREHLVKWVGPEGWPLTLCEVDFRVGGRYPFAMNRPGRQAERALRGRYLEIVPNRKIVFDNAFETPGAETMVMTVTFDEQDGRTTLTLRTLFGSLAMKTEHVGMGFVQGVGSGFDQLADVMGGLRARERPAGRCRDSA